MNLHTVWSGQPTSMGADGGQTNQGSGPVVGDMGGWPVNWPGEGAGGGWGDDQGPDQADWLPQCVS